MKPIEINLAGTPFRNDGLLWLGLAALAVGGVGFTLHNSYAFLTADRTKQELTQQLQGHRQNMDNLKREADTLTGQLGKVDRDLLATQAEFVSEILEQRNFSWTRLFNALEDVLPWDVRLTNVRPDFKDGKVTIQLSGVAQNYEALLGFEEQIEGYPQFDSVAPGDFNKADAGEQVFFNLSCNYTADAEEELPTADGAATRTNDEAQAAPAADGRNGGGSVEAGAEPEAAPADGIGRSGAARRGASDAGAPPASDDDGSFQRRAPRPGAAPTGVAARGQQAPLGEIEDRAARRRRAASGGVDPEPLPPDADFGGQLIGGNSTGRVGGGNNLPVERAPRGRAGANGAAAPNDPSAAAPRGPEAGSNERPPRTRPLNPNDYIEYDENGNPVFKPRVNPGKPAAPDLSGSGTAAPPPPPSGNGGGAP